MALSVSKVELWSATLDDRAGSTAGKLEPLSAAGADFEFVFARRTPENPGRGVMYVAPVKGTKVTRAAEQAGFTRSNEVHGLRVEGSDKPGVGARVLRAIADAGISIRGLTALAFGTKFVMMLALDSAADAAKAATLIRKL